MKKEKVFLLLQSALCVALAVLLAAAAIGLCREGLAARAENPLAEIFSPEGIAERLRPIRPLFLLTAGLAAAGLLLGVKDEDGLRPVKSGRVRNEGPAAYGRTLRTVLLLAAVILLAAGVFNGSAQDVFQKAVRICMECVGLG